MHRISYGGTVCQIESGQTVLDGLLRDGHEPPHSCRSGTCQSCLMRATDGTPPAAAQRGLKPTLKAQGYFLACLCEPAGDLTVEPAGSECGLQVGGRVHTVEPLGERIMRVRIAPDEPLDYRPGQFVNLVREDGLVRSYSLASVPDEDEHLELHVRKLPGGRMSRWIAEQLSAGTRVSVRGPSGACFYVDGQPEQPLLLIGTGTGLAPLYGIVRDALRSGHTGPIHLYHGSRERSGLYLVEQLRRLGEWFENFHYTPCLSGDEGDAVGDGVAAGRADAVALSRHPELTGWRIFLCGHPDMVQSTRKRAFLAGAGIDQIHADAFYVAPG